LGHKHRVLSEIGSGSLINDGFHFGGINFMSIIVQGCQVEWITDSADLPCVVARTIQRKGYSEVAIRMIHKLVKPLVFRALGRDSEKKKKKKKKGTEESGKVFSNHFLMKMNVGAR